MGTFVLRAPTGVTVAGPAAGWGAGNIPHDPARPTSAAALLLGINQATRSADLTDSNPSCYAGYVSGGSSPAGTWTAAFSFSGACLALDGGSPIALASLPAGAVVLTAVLSVQVVGYSGGPDAAGGLYLNLGGLGGESANLGQVALNVPVTKTYAWDFSPADHGAFLDVVNNGFGLRVVDTFFGSLGQACWNARITGTYEIRSWWWSVSLDAYVFGADPGGDYVAVDYPTPRIDSLSPTSGGIAGGTAFTITGVGFYGPDGSPSVFGVFFDGFPATSVVVVDSETITGVTPAHWAGGVGVIVSLDFEP